VLVSFLPLGRRVVAVADWAAVVAGTDLEFDGSCHEHSFRSRPSLFGRATPSLRQHAQLARQGEADVFFAHQPAFYCRPEPRLEVSDALFHDLFRCTGPGGDQYGTHAREPVVAQLVNAVNEVGRLPL